MYTCIHVHCFTPSLSSQNKLFFSHHVLSTLKIILITLWCEFCRSIHHFYNNGNFCDAIGKHRVVEVKMTLVNYICCGFSALCIMRPSHWLNLISFGESCSFFLHIFIYVVQFEHKFYRLWYWMVLNTSAGFNMQHILILFFCGLIYFLIDKARCHHLYTLLVHYLWWTDGIRDCIVLYDRVFHKLCWLHWFHLWFQVCTEIFQQSATFNECLPYWAEDMSV